MVTPLPRPRGGEERPVDRRWVRRFYFSGSFLCRHFRGGAHLEGLTTLVDGQQIGDEFARHCQSGAGKLGKLGDRRDVHHILRGQPAT